MQMDRIEIDLDVEELEDIVAPITPSIPIPPPSPVLA
jgi:hypothetical protein